MTARTGVRFVEALKSIADEARAKLQGHHPAPMEEPQAATVAYNSSDYATWASWLSATEQQQQNHEDNVTSGSGPVMDALEVPHDGAVSSPGIGGPLDASTMASPPWEEAAALQLQGLSASAFGIPVGTAGIGEQCTSPIDPYLPSAAYNDDQLYLMGLTGMDVLDFTAGF